MALAIKSLVSIAIKTARTKRYITNDNRLGIKIILDCIRASQPFTKMIATFTFLWKLISNTLYYKTGKLEKRNGFIAGSVASIAMLFETRENRIGYAQQFFMRAMQVYCVN